MIKRVVVGVSGGVDSSVAAYLLKKKGFDVCGLFMRNWDIADEKGYCSADKDAEYASYACEKIGIPFKEVSFVKEYWNEVFSPMIQGYTDGKSPNPDVLCNKFIKFGHFLKFASTSMGADVVATGHYARNSYGQFLENHSNNNAKLLKSVDPSKDQTLFLSQISQKSLQRTMFPIGGYYKSKVKELASELGLELIASKKESTGICFIGKRNFQSFMKEYSPQAKGTFVDFETGKIIGMHEGIHLWTTGQRILIGGLDKAYFVVERCPNSQIIKVVQGTDHPALYSNSLSTECPHWISDNPFNYVRTFECQFRFQHTQTPIKCVLSQNEDKTLNVTLCTPLRALSVGQFATFYNGDQCLGSGAIKKAGPSEYEKAFQNVNYNSVSLS